MHGFRLLSVYLPSPAPQQRASLLAGAPPESGCKPRGISAPGQAMMDGSRHIGEPAPSSLGDTVDPDPLQGKTHHPTAWRAVGGQVSTPLGTDSATESHLSQGHAPSWHSSRWCRGTKVWPCWPSTGVILVSGPPSGSAGAVVRPARPPFASCGTINKRCGLCPSVKRFSEFCEPA